MIAVTNSAASAMNSPPARRWLAISVSPIDTVSPPCVVDVAISESPKICWLAKEIKREYGSRE
jgi:hypothetical protein